MDPRGLYYDPSNSTGMLYSTAFWFSLASLLPNQKSQAIPNAPAFKDLKYAQQQE